MDREWMYKRIDEVGDQVLHLVKNLDVQVRLIEDLVDRVSSLEECARVTPVSRRAPAATKEKESLQ